MISILNDQNPSVIPLEILVLITKQIGSAHVFDSESISKHEK